MFAMRRDQAEEATRSRPLTLQQRLQGLKRQIEALLEEGQDDEGDEENGDWQDPRSQDLRARAEPRTDSRGVLINAAGQPITLRGRPY